MMCSVDSLENTYSNSYHHLKLGYIINGVGQFGQKKGYVITDETGQLSLWVRLKTASISQDGHPNHSASATRGNLAGTQRSVAFQRDLRRLI